MKTGRRETPGFIYLLLVLGGGSKVWCRICGMAGGHKKVSKWADVRAAGVWDVG